MVFYSYQKKEIRKDFFESDICIIGTGIAGLIIADSFRGSNLKVDILESGGFKNDDSTTNYFFDCEMKSFQYDGALKGRCRTFGGSSTKWGGQLLPLRDIDFKNRDYIENSGWPISQKDIEEYYSLGEKILGVNNESFSQNNNLNFFEENKIKTIKEIKFRFSKWSPISHRNLSKTIGKRCKNDRNTRIFLNTTARYLSLKKNSNQVEYINAIDKTGKELIFNSNIFVIACGTLETNRLLLLSRNHEGKSIGNENDNLGKFFHDHISIKAARILPKNRDKFLKIWSPKYINSTRHTLKIETSRNWQKDKKNLNTMGHFIYEEDDLSFINFLRNLFKAYQENNLKLKKINPKFFISLILNLFDLFYIGLILIIKRKKLPTKNAGIFLYIDTEQVPRKYNRLYLSKQKDIFGMNKLCIDWRFNKDEVSAISNYMSLFGKQWEKWGQGRIKWLTDFKDINNLREITKDTYHPMGGTRMSSSPDKGVVDKNLKLHNYKNLYIASCSVFPTGGSSNPTLTLIALCLRLSDHIKSFFSKT